MKTRKSFEIPNYRQFKVKVLPATNYNGTRIKIYEPKRYIDDKVQSKIYGYDYSIGDVMEQAYQILINNGFNVICRASEEDNYIFLVDSWGENFRELRELI